MPPHDRAATTDYPPVSVRTTSIFMTAATIESELQRQCPPQMGVPVTQGFLFAPGLGADEFAMRLQQSQESGLHV